MPKETIRSQVIKLLKKATIRRLKAAKLRFSLGISDDFEDELDQHLFRIVYLMEKTRYINIRAPVPKQLVSYQWFLYEMREQDFKQEFRLSRTFFSTVVDLIRSHECFSRSKTKKQAPVEVQLMLALKAFGFCGNAASLSQISRALGVGHGTVSLYTNRIVEALCSLRDEFVKWPNNLERRAMSTRIQIRYSFPDCLGFIDGTLFPLAFKPKVHGEDYYTRKA